MVAAPRKSKSTARSLAGILKPRIRPLPAGRAKARIAELSQAAKESGGTSLPKLIEDGKLGGFLAAVMESSPFLRALMLDDPKRLAAILAAAPEARLQTLIAAAANAGEEASEAELMAALRRARAEIALLTALADLGGVWDVRTFTAALTDFADAAVGAAVRFVLNAAAKAGEIEIADTRTSDEGSGWVILGMGKFGAGELNYSSDIDLIVLFDREVARITGHRDPTTVFVKLTKRLVHILQEPTADGYVFRTDLRLRPDPGTTNIAMSTDAALQYYEGLGQNWERAALIKARPVAGDKRAGDTFLAELTPYIWRKYLDYAAIADIHSIKRQIHDYRGHEQIAVAGHNIKLGRGGIREIEFFVQTQQLIAGGRDPKLRGRQTLDMLAALADGGWIDKAARDDLTRAYNALRMVEHCLQMVADGQTHTLPEDEAGLAIIARMAGYKDVATFSAAMTETLGKVQERYAHLFEAAPTLTSKLGSLVFTGDSDDPDTVATLAGLGYKKPEEVIRAVRAWHFGRYPATRSASARERLTEFVPVLIEALARAESADAAFAAFDRFLTRMPAGVQLFSILQSNPGLLDLLATILGAAPRLAETIIHRAHVLDALIEPAFFGSLPEKATVEGRLAATLAQAESFEDLLNRARIFGQEQSFLIGARVLAGTIGVRSAGHAYSDLADTLIVALTDAVRREFEAAHGHMKGGAIVLLAMGRLGGREMTAASDLDLLLLYDFDERASASDGKRPLPNGLYFARLTQRLIAAISAPTAEGTLYPVDMRLRPSGNAGPVATHIDGFGVYQAKEAWTWEHMALTRARPVAGDPRLVKRAREAIARTIATKRDAKKVLSDVLEMRVMVEDAKGGAGAWDLKQTPGGLVDIEFVAQALQLVHAASHPEIVSTETEAVLTATAKAGLLAARESEILLPALRLQQSLMQILRLGVEGVFKPEEAPRGLLERLARAGELPDFATLDAHLRETQSAVRASFERVIGKLPKK
jgi:[glutamine synthetase] adenylyltransferase / [glutamine synthetase]-adenylyl-L-tyrosine phosphorylase